jgi:8-oxo-dGTP pyrophosphatase MutT (NUDIX family)
MNNKKKIIVGVVGLPVRINSEGVLEFFLTKRYAPKNKLWHDKWQLAGGGLEFGETTEECLVREFKEELNVVPTIIHPLPIVFSNIWDADDFNHSAQILLLAYLVTIGDQKVTICDPDNETSDCSWFSEEEIRSLQTLPKTFDFVAQGRKTLESINYNSL